VLPRSGRVDGGVDHARAALALGEPRAAPVRSGWAEATQRGRGNGGKVVRKRGRGMKICRVKYYVDFGGFFIEKRAYAPLRWNHLEHEDIIEKLLKGWTIPWIPKLYLMEFSVVIA
jgi:hypothetical protein